ncbi:hypothetical protein GF351_04140 [Candidatus Woesearchaeota archaeon]|nr:hypothetical protein [Candidatus Woesearchaeota archaeon]
MKYNDKAFKKEVKAYEKELADKVEGLKGKLFFVEVDFRNRKAFHSIAPLSKAIHNMEAEMHLVIYTEESENTRLLKEVWNVYGEKKKRLKTPKVNAMMGFIREVNKRTKTKVFEEIFQPPEIYLKSEEKGFRGTISVDYRYRWFRKYKQNDIEETSRTIWKQGYDLKRGERVSIGMVLLPADKNQELPLEDYLDSFSISYSMGKTAKKMGAQIVMGASTDKFSVLARSIRSTDLMSTLLGCEIEKDIDEEVFKKFKRWSKIMGFSKLKTAQASFNIHGKGYPGKLFFADNIGYPTPDRKTRWSSVGRMLLKDRFEPQTALEPRDPKLRYGITETLPIDIFIDTCNVDYEKIGKRNRKIKKILDRCDFIRVIGKQVGKYKTDFTVNLVKPDGTRRQFIAHDCDVRTMIDEEFYKETGIKAGNYANFPGGEAFVTPEEVKGVIVGDVVINVDQSYRIPDSNPLIISVEDGKYDIVEGPKKLIETMKRERKEAMERIRNYEKAGSLPRSLTKMFRENFYQIGEFAVNLNPKARLCDYLIVNEKIAKMIHVALGMGFDPDKKTVYHWDIVINSPRQNMDIYGVDSNKKVHWVIRKGKFVV